MTKLSHVREELHLQEKLLWARHEKLNVEHIDAGIGARNKVKM